MPCYFTAESSINHWNDFTSYFTFKLFIQLYFWSVWIKFRHRIRCFYARRIKPRIYKYAMRLPWGHHHSPWRPATETLCYSDNISSFSDMLQLWKYVLSPWEASKLLCHFAIKNQLAPTFFKPLSSSFNFPLLKIEALFPKDDFQSSFSNCKSW